MDRYCVNMQAQANGDNEVHKEGCTYMPLLQNQHYLGYYASCYGAVSAARLYYPRANGCAFCSILCHTS
ncbi:hypothetical protein D3C84_400470 [compost metagenome]